MITNDIENIVARMVEQLLPRFSGNDEGLIITLEFKNLQGKEPTKVLKLLFIRPNNYTKVFSQVLSVRGEVLSPWTFRSDHDSCWSSDGLVDIFSIYMSLKSELKNEISIGPPLFGKFFEHVHVVVENKTIKSITNKD